MHGCGRYRFPVNKEVVHPSIDFNLPAVEFEFEFFTLNRAIFWADSHLITSVSCEYVADKNLVRLEAPDLFAVRNQLIQKVSPRFY